MDKICQVVFDPREHVYHCFCKSECGCAVVLWMIFSTKKLQEYAQHSLYQSVCGRLGVDLVWRIDIDSRANGSPHAQTSMDPYSQNREKKTTGNLNIFKKHYHHQQHPNHLDVQTQAILTSPSSPSSTSPSPSSSSPSLEPSGKPAVTAAHNTSSTSIYLEWTPPTLESLHGEFSGYLISYR